MKNFDAIIIGSGQGGVPLAKKLAQHGWKTAIIEKDLIGGTCINAGCTPTKTMVASAKEIYNASKAKNLGVEIAGYKVNLKKVKQRKDKIVRQFREGTIKGLESTKNLTIIHGTASFTDKNKISISTSKGIEEITGKKIFLNGGARPTILPIEGLNEIKYLTSTSIMELTEVPAHLLIIGGSYVGLEFGQMFRRFGSKITVLEHGDNFLPKEDEDICSEIQKFLETEGIKIFAGTHVTKITKKNKVISVHVESENKNRTIKCTHVLLAAGRTPNTDILNLNAAGVKTDERGHIKVNDKLETNIKNIFALGDIKGGPEFTHISYNDYIVLADNLINKANRTIKNRPVPYCMFTDPQLGRIGITEKEAIKQGLKFKVAVLPMTRVARAIETGDTRGMMKAIVDAKTGLILGAAILGEEGGEIMTILQMAIAGKIKYTQIREMIFAHPLYAESLNNLFMTLDKD
ncbi:MAG: dihydrolipoyl dehydrogenase [Bacteroidetes bacterium]|nr:dihydrolipoyl dehydrogenase [Bacteroidota bacterium]